MTSASRVGDRPSDETCRRTKGFQSGILATRHAPDRVNEGRPRRAAACEHFLDLLCQLVVAPPTFACFFNPRARNPPSLLDAVQKRIERVDVKDEQAAR